MNAGYATNLERYQAASVKLHMPEGVLIASTGPADSITVDDEDTAISHKSRSRGKGYNRRALEFGFILEKNVSRSRPGYGEPETFVRLDDTGYYWFGLTTRDRSIFLEVLDNDSVDQFDAADEAKLHPMLRKWEKITGQTKTNPAPYIDMMVRMYWHGIDRTLKRDIEEAKAVLAATI